MRKKWFIGNLKGKLVLCCSKSISKAEFELGYISRSGITPEVYHKNFVTLPCECGADVCEGWAAIHNTQEMIDLQNELYAPKLPLLKSILIN